MLCLSLLVIVHRQHDPQRRAADARRATSDADATASCSGSSTRTRSCSPACCSPRAASATGSGAAARSQVGLVVFGVGSLASALRRQRRPADRHPGVHGHRRRVHHAGDAVDPHQRLPARASAAQAIGIWAGVAGLGVAIGPVIGGFLLEHFWWGSIFLVNVPIVDRSRLIAGFFLVPTSKDPSAPQLDPVGAVLSIVGLVALAVRHHRRRRPTGWTDRARSSARSRVGASSLLAAFVVVGAPHRPPDARRRASSRTRASPPRAAAITLMFFAMFGSIFLLTQYLQFVLGYSPLEAGVRLLPCAVAMMIVRAAERDARRARSAPRSSSPTGLRSLATSASVLIVDARPSTAATARRRARAWCSWPAAWAHDGARDRVDHGLAAARQGRRRLGGQRHHPRGRRRARRRHHRQRDVVGLRRRRSPTFLGGNVRQGPAVARGIKDSLGAALSVAGKLSKTAPRRRGRARPVRPTPRSSTACTGVLVAAGAALLGAIVAFSGCRRAPATKTSTTQDARARRRSRRRPRRRARRVRSRAPGRRIGRGRR